MRQLLLDLKASEPQTFDSFVAGGNQELLQRFLALRSALTQTEKLSLSDRFVYVWGEAGAGKTHLLQSLAHAMPAHYLSGDAEPQNFVFDPTIRLYLLDDCDRLSADSQVAAFALFNQVRENGAALVAAGSLPPAQLTVREDLRTRLAWGLVYQVQGLTDDEKIAALNQAAQARGLVLSSGVLPYLITHFHRDMRSLSAMLDALDRYSLETKRPITLPLLRELLQQGDEARTQ